MNKTELIEKMSKEAGVTKADAGRCLEAFTNCVKKTLKKGEPVQMVGFGTFTLRKRPARKGRNPQTGAEIKIKASKNAGFKAGKALKDALN